MTAGYEILEHTADVGIRAWGESANECFEQAGWGLADLLGATADAPAQERVLTASGADRGALLVDFLNELIALHETEEVAFGEIDVSRLSDSDLVAVIGVAPLPGEAVTTGIKAATYHRLEVRESEGDVEARVYLDV